MPTQKEGFYEEDNPFIRRQKSAQLAPSEFFPWGNHSMTMFTPTSAEVARVQGDAQRMRHAIINQLYVNEGLVADAEREPSLKDYGMSPVELEPVRPAGVIPYGIDAKARAIFVLAKKNGVLGEILDSWRAVGKPKKFDAESVLWRGLVRELVLASTRARAEIRDAYSCSGVFYSAPSGIAGPWTEHTLSGWSKDFFSAPTGSNLAISTRA